MFHNYGILGSSYGRSGGPVEIPNLTLSGGIFTASYIPLVGELNKPPYVDDLVISGTPREGQTLTATLTGGVLGPFTAGTHQYQWYRLSALFGGTLTSISGATSSTYVPVAADVTKYLVCAARFVQVEGTNNMSSWFYSLPTDIIKAAALSDISHAWLDFFDIETGVSVPANWNDAGVSPSLTNLGSNGTAWTAASTTKPTFSTNKLVFANAHKVTGTSLTFPPVCEIWIKGKFTANNGAMIGYGSQTLLGMNTSNQFFVRDTAGIAVAGDLNEHVFRIVLNGTTSILQIDGGTVNTFDENFSSATSLAFGQTFSNANPADCEIKRFQRTVSGTLLTPQEVADKWAYHGF